MKHTIAFWQVAALFPLLAGVTNANAEKKPNILFAFGDDLGRYQSIYHAIEGGSTPNSIISTPNFDRIAAEGALFLNAHVCAPSSTPCRSALLSGQYFWRTDRGAILQGAEWNNSIPSFPLMLQQDGYHIGRTYKVWSPGTPANAPYGGTKNTFERAGTDFCRFSQTVLQKTEQSQIENEKKRLYNEVVSNFDQFMEARDPGQPFCYWWGPWNTHREWSKGSGKKLWNINPDDLKGKIPACLPDIPEIREDFADYLGEVLAFDHALGLLLKRLEELGELDNTIIVVSGDHGIPGFPRAKCNLYHFGTHVPLAVRYPPVVERGRVIDDFVNLMDLAPTFLEAGGLQPPAEMTGRSLISVLSASGSGQIDPSRNYVVTGRERHVAAARPGRLPYPQRAITQVMEGRKYKYIRNFAPERWPVGHINNKFPDLDGGPTKDWYIGNYCNPDFRSYMELAFEKRPYEELYDVDADYYEMSNLVGNASMQEIKRILSEKLERILKETGDPRMEEGVAKFDRMPFTCPNN